MGNTYSNITVRSNDPLAVGKILKSLQRFAVITPDVNDHVVVFDRASDMDLDEMIEIGEAITEKLSTVALAVHVHDDSVLNYWLFENGVQVDRYISKPHYFGPTEDVRGGSPEVVTKAWGLETKQTLIAETLHTDEDAEDRKYVFETDRHYDLVEILGLNMFAVGFGYTYLVDGEYPDGFERNEVYYTEPEDADD